MGLVFGLFFIIIIFFPLRFGLERQAELQVALCTVYNFLSDRQRRNLMTVDWS